VSTVIYFCSHCNENRETFEYYEGSHLKVRCQVCGYPVEEEVVRKEGVSFGRPKILCIDDDQLLLGLFVNALESYDFQAITATDGPSGIEKAKKERPDLILLDVMMPGMDGYEVCRRMRADPDLKETPIIIITAMTDPKLNVKGFQAGANLATKKPFDPKKLVDTIKTALALKTKPRTT
jgi:DNA-binding response OmpR family regulator/DNA-directed RNA polymerase subunit RPC12/RpoP